MSIKKLGCAIMSAAILLMAGCSTSETSGNSGNASNAEGNVGISPNGQYPIVTDNSVELTVWAILSSEIEDYSTNTQSKWYEEYSGIKVNWINIPRNGWADQFKLSVMSGEYPDIYLYDFDTTEVQACAELDAIIPLNDLIDEYCPNIKKYLDDDSELKASVTAPDGNIYTLFSKSYNTAAYKHKLWVNKNWLEMYKNDTGKDMPQTTDDFENMLVYFKEHDMNGNGDPSDEIPFLGYDGLDGMYFLFNAFVTSNSSQGAFGCYLDNNQLKFAFNNDEYREALKYINRLYKKGLISDQTFTISQSDRFAYTNGTSDKIRAGVVSSVTADSIVQLSNNTALPDYSDYVAIPPLAGPNGHRTFVTDGEYTISLKNAITSSCKYPEIAARWLDYWYSEEGRLWSINDGREGVDWEYSDGNTLFGNGKIVKPIKGESGNTCWAGQGVAYMISADDFTHMDADSIATNNVLATYNADLLYHSYAVDTIWKKILWIDGVNTTNDDSIEYSEVYGLINRYVIESYTNFILGKKDISDDSEWRSYTNELNKMGLQRYLELVELYVSNSK